MITECQRANTGPRGDATRHWYGAAATTLIGLLRRFVTGDPATAALGRNPRLSGEDGKVRFRRILLVAASSAEGLLTERRTAAQPWRRELAFMSSRPEDSHLWALPDPYVNLSIHTAPDVRPFPGGRRKMPRLPAGFEARSRDLASTANPPSVDDLLQRTLKRYRPLATSVGQIPAQRLLISAHCLLS